MNLDAARCSAARCHFALPILLGLVLAIPATGDLLADGDSKSPQITLGRSVHDARCASCHGKMLEGQPNWQSRLPNGRLPAPPHDASGHTWHHPDRVLIGVIKNGLKPYAGSDYESDMPAFSTLLSDKEVEAVIAYIKSTWPEREREHQERITRNSLSSQ